MERKVIVTGGSIGIGLAITCKFLAAGYEIIVVDKDRIANEMVRESPEGDSIQIVDGDLSDHGSPTCQCELRPVVLSK